MRFIYQKYTTPEDKRFLHDAALYNYLLKQPNFKYLTIEEAEPASLAEFFIFGSIDFVKKCNGFFEEKEFKSLFDAGSVSLSLPEYFLNAAPDGELTSWQYFKENFWDYYRDFAEEAKIFIRPNDTYKSFTGQSVDIQELDNFLKENSFLDPKFCIWVAKPKKIRAEWRLVCTKTEIITGSLYLYQGLRSLVKGFPPQVKHLVDKILIPKFTNFLPPIFTIDVCLLDNDKQEYKVVEFNPLQSAGLYDCDRVKIINKIVELYESGSIKNTVGTE